MMKLVSKSRHGAKVYKVYDRARTPYQRLLEAGVLTEANQQELTTIYHGLNPVSLLRQINKNLENLWKLAEYPVQQQRKVRTYQASVTVYFDAIRVIQCRTYTPHIQWVVAILALATRSA